MPLRPVGTVFVSTLPSGNITLNSLFKPANEDKSCELSTVIAVVVADLTLPDRLSSPRTGSLIAITLPGLTIAPASIEVVKLTTSDSCCSLNNTALANLIAWVLDVVANAFIVFLTIPNFATAAVSSWTSLSISLLSILK